MTTPMPDCPVCGWAMQPSQHEGHVFCIGDNCRDFCKAKSVDDVERERAETRARIRAEIDRENESRRLRAVA